jgi:monoamine oxidase
MRISRREFVRRVGILGGVGAAHVAMEALGLAPIQMAYAGPPSLPPESGHGTKVVILGAGMAGLTAGYELRKAGYDVTILEARERVGGRNWTIRRGTHVDLNHIPEQRCAFEDDLYFNAGPGRIPSHHQAVLGYCREFGVELQVEVNSNRSALLLNQGVNDGRPLQQRQVINDTRGHVSELLAKAIKRGALDHEMTSQDKERVVEFLRIYGDLSPDLFYKGSTRSGFRTLPGASFQEGVQRDPIDMRLLLDEDLWSGVVFEDVFVMQATMFQPVGGMDRIPAAFHQRLHSKIRLGAQVIEITKLSEGVRIVYRERGAGGPVAITAAYAIVTIPLPVLAGIKSNFSVPFKRAIARTAYDCAVKVAWQSTRFWETEDHIYGGISFLKGETNLVWYPSNGFQSPQGILLACYNTGDDARRFGALPVSDQYARTRGAVNELHPGHGPELINPVAVSWQNVPFNLGPWVHWPEGPNADYKLLNQGEGRVYLAGEHLSHINGWQEGAVLSAHRVVSDISDRERGASLSKRAHALC